MMYQVGRSYGMTGRVEIDSVMMVSKPMIRGTCTPVQLLLRKLSKEATEADLLDACTCLNSKDIRAMLFYAADPLACEIIQANA